MNSLQSTSNQPARVRPQLRWKEVLWMLLPVALLAGAGLFVSRNPNSIPFARDNGPLRLVIERAEVVSITPREVFEGYDTKIEIVGNKVGRSIKPQKGVLATEYFAGVKDAHLTLKNGRSNHRYRSLRNGASIKQVMAMGRNDAEITFLLKAATLPVTKQPLWFRGEVESSQTYVIAAKPQRRIVDESVSAPVEILLRRAGEKITFPRPSRYNPIKISETQIDRVPKFTPDRGEDTVVRIYLTNTQDPEKVGFQSVLNTRYIQDAKGKRYYKFLYGSGPTGKRWDGIVGGSGSRDSGGGFVHFLLPLKQIPANAGRLTLHADIYVNDCWPRHVSVVVRAK